MIFEREFATTADGLCLVFDVGGGEGRVWHWLCCTRTSLRSLGAYLSKVSTFMNDRPEMLWNKTISVHILQEENSSRREITLCKPDGVVNARSHGRHRYVFDGWVVRAQWSFKASILSNRTLHVRQRRAETMSQLAVTVSLSTGKLRLPVRQGQNVGLFVILGILFICRHGVHKQTYIITTHE